MDPVEKETVKSKHRGDYQVCHTVAVLEGTIGQERNVAYRGCLATSNMNAATAQWEGCQKMY